MLKKANIVNVPKKPFGKTIEVVYQPSAVNKTVNITGVVLKEEVKRLGHNKDRTIQVYAKKTPNPNIALHEKESRLLKPSNIDTRPSISVAAKGRSVNKITESFLNIVSGSFKYTFSSIQTIWRRIPRLENLLQPINSFIMFISKLERFHRQAYKRVGDSHFF